MDSAEVIQQLEALRAEYEAKIALLESEKARLYHAIGTLAYEVKCLKGLLQQRGEE